MPYKDILKRKKKQQEYYQENKELLKNKRQNYYRKNKLKCLKNMHKRYILIKPKIALYNKNYRKINVINLTNQRKKYNNIPSVKIHQRDYSLHYNLINKKKIKKYRHNHYINNKIKLLNYNKQYYQKNKENILKRNKIYMQNNKQKINIYRNEYQKNREKTDINYKLKNRMRLRIRLALKGVCKSETTTELIGCSIDNLRIHLEKQWLPNMSWNNYGYGIDKWNVDHIIPCAYFNHKIKNERLKCHNYINLQPMWQIDNMKKGDNIGSI